MGLFGEAVPKTAENFVSRHNFFLLVLVDDSPTRIISKLNPVVKISALSVLEKRGPESLESLCTTRVAFSTVSVSSLNPPYNRRNQIEFSSLSFSFRDETTSSKFYDSGR